MIALLLWNLTAWAAKPGDLSLEDVFAWEDAANNLLEGPSGCWQVTAVADRKMVFFIPPDMFSNGQKYEEVVRADVTGRLEDGVWKQLAWENQKLTKDQRESINPILRAFPMMAEDMDVLPMMGKLDDDNGAVPSNMVREMVDDWGGRMFTSHTEWDDERDGVWLRREVPVRDKPKAPVSQVSTFFPQGGLNARSLDVIFPKSFKAGLKWIRFRLDNAQIHLRTVDVPGGIRVSEESASLLIIGLGITMGYEQTIQYTAFEPCESPTQ